MAIPDQGLPSISGDHNIINIVDGDQINNINHYHIVIQQSACTAKIHIEFVAEYFSVHTTGNGLLSIESNALPDSMRDLRAISWQIAGIADQLIQEQQTTRGPVNPSYHEKLKAEIQSQIIRAVELNYQLCVSYHTVRILLLIYFVASVVSMELTIDRMSILSATL